MSELDNLLEGETMPSTTSSLPKEQSTITDSVKQQHQMSNNLYNLHNMCFNANLIFKTVMLLFE